MGDYYRYYYQKSLSYWKSVLGKYLLLALLLGIFSGLLTLTAVRRMLVQRKMLLVHGRSLFVVFS